MLQICSRITAVKTFIQLPYFEDIKLAIYMPESFLRKSLVVPSGSQTDEFMHCSLGISYVRMLNEVRSSNVSLGVLGDA